MNQNQTEPKPAAAEQPADEGLDVTICCASLNDPPTPHPSGAWDRTDFIRYSEKLEAVLQKFMAVTETSDAGITRMATIEGRVKFYERLRTIRAEAHGILSHNATVDAQIPAPTKPESITD